MIQCKDIPDLPILRFIESHNDQWCFMFSPEISERSVFLAMPEGTPYKLALAKMRTLG